MGSLEVRGMWRHPVLSIRKPNRNPFAPVRARKRKFKKRLTYRDLGNVWWVAYEDNLWDTFQQTVPHLRHPLNAASNVYSYRKPTKIYSRPFVALHVGRFGYGLD
jgi:hypothetical protein